MTAEAKVMRRAPKAADLSARLSPAFATGEVPAPPEGLLACWLAGWAGDRTLVHVARSEARATRLARAVRDLAPEVRVLTFPAWDCLPYDRASPARSVMGRRMAVLRRLAAREAGPCLVLTVAEAVLQLVPPRAAVRDAAFRLKVGDRLDTEGFRRFLLAAGYVVDERVDEPGEAAIRGAAVDLYPAARRSPYRLELDGEQVVAIRTYDPLSQRSVAEVSELLLEPASELLLPDELARPAEEDTGAPDWVANLLTEGPGSPRRGGCEHLLPLAYAGMEGLLDYLPDAALVLDPDAEERLAGFLDQVQDAQASRLALSRAGAEGALVLDPGKLYLDAEGWAAAIAGRPRVTLTEAEGEAPPRFTGEADPGRAFARHLALRLAAGDRVVVAAGAEAERARLARFVERASGTVPAVVASLAEAVSPSAANPALLRADLPAGFSLAGLTVIAARDVLGRQAAAGAGGAAEAFVPNGLHLGDRVVHAEHGIAVLRAIGTLEQEGVESEFLALEFAGEDRMLVPALAVDQLWRYGSAESEVSLDRMDGEAWRSRRAEVEAELARMAASLVELAAERAKRSAPVLKPPRQRYARFAARFAFEETEDQALAIEATLADLARGSPPMDRLVCGDVGYGKTEVALRAAAATALSGRQVALLAPTTVLVRQHLDTFRRRFAGLDLKVGQLSRLARTAEAREVKQGLADGSVRIVIGTHALASPDLRFKDLGLVIIDEEQRFGTRHKAALRRLGAEVHLLTMSATPIPRTLQAALAGLQELSVIATPPVRRQPIRTYLLPFDPAVVREALMRERARGGRSFFVCPRIADIEPMARRLAEIVPELDVAAAHGRMKAEDLDDVVLAFAQGRHDVLLTTAIIETGLDIPGANTMLVWHAERFGMAQLHQLRGRVGRGRERAAAYLLHEPGIELPAAAQRRLRTLEAFERLGAGFAISARDLDLRGAGDLLGEDQAGHLRLIGTELYQHLLERALRQARGERLAPDWSPELRLGIGMAIPAAYVPEPEVRLDLYGRLARLASEAAIDDLAEEIGDRFGPVPDEVGLLLGVAGLRLRCREADVARLEVGPKGTAASFRGPVKAERRFKRRIEAAPGAARWSGERVVLAREAATPAERLAAAEELLGLLAD